MMNFTTNELQTLQAIDLNEYGKSLRDEVWTFTLQQNHPGGVSGKSISGTISSLVKKGAVRVSETGDASIIGMTEFGEIAYVKAMRERNLKVKKLVSPKCENYLINMRNVKRNF